MKLSEVLEQVDTLVPNSINVRTKISWINHVQNQLYRDYPLPESVKVYAIRRNQQLYILPDDCSEDRITNLVVNHQSYPYMPDAISTESSAERFCTIVSGTLMIYPVPTADTDGFLYYKARPTTMTTATMDLEPSFPKDFHELLVFGTASRVAKSAGDLNRSSVFDGDYRQLAEKADLVLVAKRQTRVITVRSWA